MRANMGIFFHSFDKYDNFSITLMIKGIYCSCMAYFSESGTAVLLISCDVSPKWTNSLNLFSFNSSNRPLREIFNRFYIMVGNFLRVLDFLCIGNREYFVDVTD